AARVRHSQLAPSALEVDWPAVDAPVTVCALIEDIGGAGARSRAGDLAAVLGEGASLADNPPPWWGTAPWHGDGTALKLAVRPSRLPGVLEALHRHPAGLPVAVRGSLGSGVVYAGLPADAQPGAVVELVEA